LEVYVVMEKPKLYQVFIEFLTQDEDLNAVETYIKIATNREEAEKWGQAKVTKLNISRAFEQCSIGEYDEYYNLYEKVEAGGALVSEELEDAAVYYSNAYHRFGRVAELRLIREDGPSYYLVSVRHVTTDEALEHTIPMEEAL